MTTNRGMSLVEVLIYIGILTFLVVVIMNTLASISQTARLMRESEARTRSAVTMLNRLDRAIKAAEDVSGGGASIVIDGQAFDVSQFVETDVMLSDLNYELTDASTSVKVRTTFTLDDENYYSATVLFKTP